MMNDFISKNIDIREDYLLKKDNLLELLLKDKTTNKNILWATDSYESKGKKFSSNSQITCNLITGTFGSLIQPRAAKSKEEKIYRTREKAEVFTPLSIIKEMNDKSVDRLITKNNWQEYVAKLKLEITCGEAPYIVTRYDPVSDKQKLLPLSKRVGFLDRKLFYISKFCSSHKDWLHWTRIAYQSSYGYEWQGDSLLIARENLLYTFIDYYRFKFNKNPSLNLQREFVEIIVWNIFQMDGLKFVIPMSCKNEKLKIKGKQTLFGIENDTIQLIPCESCDNKTYKNHNGVYVKVMDWIKGQDIRFVDIVK